MKLKRSESYYYFCIKLNEKFENEGKNNEIIKTSLFDSELGANYDDLIDNRKIQCSEIERVQYNVIIET